MVRWVKLRGNPDEEAPQWALEVHKAALPIYQEAIR